MNLVKCECPGTTQRQEDRKSLTKVNCDPDTVAFNPTFDRFKYRFPGWVLFANGCYVFRFGGSVSVLEKQIRGNYHESSSVSHHFTSWGGRARREEWSLEKSRKKFAGRVLKKPEEKVASKERREWSVTRQGGSAIDLLCCEYRGRSAFDDLKTGQDELYTILSL